MACREVKAEIKRVPYPEGGSSHGDTCCSCGRKMGDRYWAVRIGTWNLQACRRGCAVILARWIAYRQSPPMESLTGPICLAHDCSAVAWARERGLIPG